MNKVKQDAFKKIKRIVACDMLLAYLYFDKEFKIHTNDGDFKLEAVIIHEGRPISF